MFSTFTETCGKLDNKTSIAGENFAKLRCRLWTNIEYQLALTDVVDVAAARLGIGGKFARNDHIDRHRNAGAIIGICRQSARRVEHVGLVQGITNTVSIGGDKRIGDATANDQGIDDVGQRVEHR